MTLPDDTKKKLETLLEGILLGRTLQDLEKQAGARAEDLLKALRTDEQAFLEFKSVREFSAFAIEDDISTRLRDNLVEPKSAVVNNALKIWADHMRWVAERRNPAIYSGKAALHMTVPIQILTDLDLGATKTIEGVYELKADIVEEKPIDEILGPADELAALPSPSPRETNPFGGAVPPEQAPAREKTALELLREDEAGPVPAGWPGRVHEGAPLEAPGLDATPDGPVAARQPRAKRARASKNAPPRAGKTEESS